MKHASIVKGNASEIMSLANQEHKTRGVDSTHTTAQAKRMATELANQYGFTVVVSGPIDFITDGKREAEAPFGSSLMSLVTGMGCALTAVIAALRGVLNDSFKSAELATLYFGLCGQLAEKRTQHPGTFRSAFIDALYEADFENI
jgi:hydroxyethylthiazole kinase